MAAMRSKLTLGERIIVARSRVGAKQGDIAAICGTTRQQVSKWERGTAVPDLIQTVKMAQYLGSGLDWFIEDLVIDLTDHAPRKPSRDPAQQNLFMMAS
jgi:transcriptional regulator with XRE-family HTH domain